MADVGKKAQNPVETEVSEILITSVTEKFTMDITDLVSAIDINENINTRILTATMAVTDGMGLLHGMPLVGQEKVTFKIAKGPIGAQHKQWEKELEFFVRSIENVDAANDCKAKF